MKRKKLILIASLSAVLATALVTALLGAFVFGWFDGREEAPYVPPTLEEGEAYYYFAGNLVRDVVLLYPQLDRSDIVTVRVHNAKGENYYFYHNIQGASNYFLLGTSEDESFEVRDGDLYYPPIIGAWGGAFDYTSLYDDSSTLPAMLAAVGSVRIGERLRPEDGDFSEAWLSHYGLATADDPAYFELVTYLRDGNGNYIYTDGADAVIGRDPEDGRYYRLREAADGTWERGEAWEGDATSLIPMADTANSRRVYVGNRTVDDTGFYLRLEGRNTVYTTTTSAVSDVVNRSVGYYVAPRAVTASESGYAYQLSPNLSIYQGAPSTDPETVITALMSMGLRIDDLWTSGAAGGTHRTDAFRQIDLEAADAALRDAFVGAHIGDARDVLLYTDRLAEPSEIITYHITRIDGYFDAATHRYYAASAATDRFASAGDVLLVSYRIGDGDTVYTGVLDTGRADLPVALRTLLDGASFGDIETVSYTVDYGALSGVSTADVEYGLVEISRIVDRATGAAAEVAGPGCDVTLRFYNKRGDVYLGESVSVTLRLPDAADATDADWLTLNGEGQSVAVLRAMGALVAGQGIASWQGASAPHTTLHCPIEFISDFTLYTGARASYVNRYEEIVSIGYRNESNVFFGSQRYAITGPDARTLYAPDYSSTISALRIFEDLTGDETVALGLDAETIDRYGLYAYRVLYEMPFDCYSVTQEDGGENYYHKSTVTYELLIGETLADGSRYVGSTQYDSVIRFADGGTFDFVEWSFEERWAQNNLLLVSYEDLRSMVVDLNFSDGGDYSHIWAFDTAVDRAYPYETHYYQNGVLKTDYSIGSRLYTALVDGGAHDGGRSWSELTGLLQYEKLTDPSGENRTEAGKLVLDHGYTERLRNEFSDLDALYGNRTDPDKPQYYDGATYFQTLLQIMNTTLYSGTVRREGADGFPIGYDDVMTDEEVTALMADESACVMTIAFRMRDAHNATTGYTMRFYTYSQHTLVSITDEQTHTETHDFYIRTREVYKIAEAVVALTRGEAIDSERY